MLRALCLTLMLAAALAGCGKPATDAGLPVVGFVQLLEDAQLDAGRAGFLQALTDSGLVAGRDYVLDYRCAQGDQSLLPAIMQGFLDRKVTLIATSTTPCMLAAARATAGLPDPPPVVCTIVSPPDRVGLRAVPATLTGWYEPVEMAEFVAVIRDALGASVRTLGLLTCPGEPNAALAADGLAAACDSAGITLVRMPVNSVNDLADAASALAAQDVQAFLAAADNTVYSGLPVLARIAAEKQIPVFTSEANMAQHGAAVGWGLDYADWGYQSGAVAAQLLRGTPLRDLPLRPCRRYQVYVNREACARQGLIPATALLQRATKLL